MNGRVRGRRTRALTPFCRGAAVACYGLAIWFALPLAAEPMDVGLEFYRARIEPVLVAHCYECHSARAAIPEGGLRVDRPELLRAGGDSGPALVPGQAAASLLLQALRHENGLEMPPDKPRLPDTVLRDFERWIGLGAPMAPAPVAEGLPRHDPRGDHWAFQPITRPTIPAVRAAEWIASPIDAFVLQQLEQRGFEPAPAAERWVWLRRVYFDLIGLPPTPDEMDAYLNDVGTDADERVVDRLLASPRYGERWGQHWLDVVRYAETEGYEYDRHVPDAWRFRDYVIEAWNADRGFHQFVREQLAGDELDANHPTLQTASIFHRLGPVRRNAGNPDIALSRNEVLTERTDIIGAAFLGLTIGCARCHNHKLEPISQRDYYSLQAYFAATEENNIVLASAEEQDAWQRETKRITDRIQGLRGAGKEAVGAEKERLEKEIEQWERQLPPPLPTIPATVNRHDTRTPIHILRRGVWESKGEPVAPRPPGILVSPDLPSLPPDAPHPRSQLAEWLVSPDHPLTARVLVNRIWQHHFGIGLVKTANDFGTQGDPPSHRELLDWLASTFIEGEWQIKPLHRLMVLSSSYRQSDVSPHRDAYQRLDPDNRSLWQFRRRRLSAEELRDAMLAVSGQMNLRAGGPSVMVEVDAELVQLLYKPSQWQVAAVQAEQDRRSIYLIAKRNLRLPFAESFDAPALLTSCARRESSTHAPQALELLNGGLSNRLAEAFAKRLNEEAGKSVERRVELAFRLALGRGPTEAERWRAESFARHESLREFALAVLNLNGFLYVQ